MMIDKEEMLLRELAGGRCVIPKVTDELGPMSLWSKAGLEAEIRKAVEVEREACAVFAEECVCGCGRSSCIDGNLRAHNIAESIRSRGDKNE